MDVDAASAIRAQLGPHERLLWTGRPRRGLLFHPSDALVLPFGLVWLAVAVEGVGGADARHTSLVPQLLSVVCVLVGLFVIAGRFPLNALRRSAIYYGVTNERVLIVRLRYSAAVTAWRLRDLGGVAVVGKGDEGTLMFDVGPNASRGLARFERIPEARRVANIISGAQRGETRRTGVVTAAGSRPAAHGGSRQRSGRTWTSPACRMGPQGRRLPA